MILKGGKPDKTEQRKYWFASRNCNLKNERECIVSTHVTGAWNSGKTM